MNKQPRPKVTCPGCNREVSKQTAYSHKRNGCPPFKKHRALPELDEVIERQVYWIGDDLGVNYNELQIPDPN